MVRLSLTGPSELRGTTGGHSAAMGVSGSTGIAAGACSKFMGISDDEARSISVDAVLKARRKHRFLLVTRPEPSTLMRYWSC